MRIDDIEGSSPKTHEMLESKYMRKKEEKIGPILPGYKDRDMFPLPKPP